MTALKTALRSELIQRRTEAGTESLREKFVRIAKSMGVTKDLGSLVMNVSRSMKGNRMSDDAVKKAIRKWQLGSAKGQAYGKARLNKPTWPR